MARRDRSQEPSRRLLDHLAGPRDLGTPEALFATTFDLNPTFVELDYLPTVLGVSTWDDSSAKGRIELEQQLARIGTVALAMDGRRYQGRPRSLRVHLTPATLRVGRALHAKVTLIVHEDAVRLLVGSANLTDDGYRHNREVALSIVAREKRAPEARLVAQALAPMRTLLEPWWSDQIATVCAAAGERLRDWISPAQEDDDAFLWSGPGTPLWQRFLERWPAGEAVNEIVIVSPFWSDEGHEGPLVRLLQGLRGRRADLASAKLRLITSAERDRQGTYRPCLPAGFAGFDFRTLGLPVTAAAASPEVDKDDVGRDDFLRERRLHAKSLLLVGPKTSLAYLGSANFTVPGWGFGSDQGTNVEAGVALIRRGNARAVLRAILPPTCSEIALDRAAPAIVGTAAELEEGQKPFPWFLRNVELRPEEANPGRLELVISLAEKAPGPFTITLEVGEEATTLLSGSAKASDLSYTVVLEPDRVRDLLRQRAVAVRWEEDGLHHAADFPLNVSAAAREALPFADPSALPRENELIAYYQGRIAFSDVFPDVSDDDSHGKGSASEGSPIETDNILSYRIRGFVEALPGIRRELSQSVATANTIRLAFFGPVSPVALAKEIMREVSQGRSMTAAAFQLVELLACVRSVTPSGELSERLSEAWSEAVSKARSELERLHEQLKAASPALAASPTFSHYERTILGGTS